MLSKYNGHDVEFIKLKIKYLEQAMEAIKDRLYSLKILLKRLEP